MNCITTEQVSYRGKEIPISSLKPNSQIKVSVKCRHGERQIKWCRIHQWCRKCTAEAGMYNTSSKERKITWGNKISKAKKGKEFTEEHKKALIAARKKKVCERLGILEDKFPGFPTKGSQYKLRLFMAKALKRSVIRSTIEEQDQMFVDFLGYSVEELKRHLESKFQPNMSWENYGEWEIDHIRPDSWFNYNSHLDDDFKKSWSLTNLQPLWADQNRKKNNLYEGPYKKRHFYMLCGQSGAGKTTLTSYLHHKFTVVQYDSVNIKELDAFIRKNWANDKPILIDIPMRISTNIKRYQDDYEITPVFLIEDIETIKERINKRGGRTSNVERRYNRMVSLSKRYGKFTGNFEQVKEYLLNV